MSAAVCLAQHKQGMMTTEGSTDDTKYVCTTWMIERSPLGILLSARRRIACASSVFARSIYLRLHKHGVSVMRCSLHPSVLLAFTSSQGDNRAELKRGWRELRKEGGWRALVSFKGVGPCGRRGSTGAKCLATGSAVVILRWSPNLSVGL